MLFILTTKYFYSDLLIRIIYLPHSSIYNSTYLDFPYKHANFYYSTKLLHILIQAYFYILISDSLIKYRNPHIKPRKPF